MVVVNPLMQLFGQSPFKPLQEHVRIAIQCANEVPVLFKEVKDGNEKEVEACRVSIYQLENQADEIKNELRAHLPKSLFMPVDRRDLLEILDLQDSIADTAQDIAGMMVVRPMSLPDLVYEPLMELTHQCVSVCNHLGAVMEEFDGLLETGFRGAESEKVLIMLDQLNEKETQTDIQAIKVMKLLFENEEEIGSVSTIMWDRVIHWVGDLANYSERAGNRHRLLLAH